MNTPAAHRISTVNTPCRRSGERPFGDRQDTARGDRRQRPPARRCAHPLGARGGKAALRRRSSRTTPAARPLCPAPGSCGARRADTQRLLPRDFSPRLVALAPPRWCGGGVFCCAPRWDYRVGALSLDRCPGPSKCPPSFGRQVPILACPCCDSRCIERLSVRKHGLLRKKAHGFCRKVHRFSRKLDHFS